MESSTPTDITEEFRSPTSRPADLPTAEVQVSPTPSIREQCSACGATLAPDQRYCVECGQRCGPGRMPSTVELAQRLQAAPSSHRASTRPRMSPNSTLIAGIGTLLLAMGIGVLIGRTGNNSNAKAVSPPVQIVTVPGAAGAPSGASNSAAPAGPSATAAKTTKSTGASPTAGAKSTSKAPAAAPPVKVVKVGTPGKGPGYQQGHFTGNFFGE